MNWFGILKIDKLGKFIGATIVDGFFYDSIEYTTDFPEGRPAKIGEGKEGHYRFHLYQDEVDWKSKNEGTEENPFMAPRLNLPYADIVMNEDITDFEYIAGDKDIYNRLRNLWDGLE
jgi:hypothetical protein